jgi:hypothetical protein
MNKDSQYRAYPKWSVVNKLQNQILRLLVVTTARNQEIAEGLEQGFPHLYGNTAVDSGPIPLSACRTVVEMYAEEGNGDDYACEMGSRLELPYFYFEDPKADGFSSRDVPMQADLKGLVVAAFGEMKKAGINTNAAFPRQLKKLTYGEVEYFVVWMSDNWETVCLVPCDSVDIDVAESVEVQTA